MEEFGWPSCGGNSPVLRADRPAAKPYYNLGPKPRPCLWHMRVRCHPVSATYRPRGLYLVRLKVLHAPEKCVVRARRYSGGTMRVNFCLTIELALGVHGVCTVIAVVSHLTYQQHAGIRIVLEATRCAPEYACRGLPQTTGTCAAIQPCGRRSDQKLTL